MPERTEIQIAIAALDASASPTTDAHVYDSIRGAVGSEPDFDALGVEDQAEVLAFSLSPGSELDPKAPARAYYGAKVTHQLQNGEVRAWPRIDEIAPEALHYWRKRAREARHPVLCARYADLVWDLAWHIAKERPEIEFAHIAIDAILEVVARGVDQFDSLLGQRLTRALQLALSISDQDRVSSVVRAILEFDRETESPDSRRPRGFAFDVLLLDNPELKISENTRDALLAKEVSLFERYVSGGKVDPVDAPGAERVANRLVRFYRKVNEREGVVRVLQAFGQGYVEGSRQASAIVRASELQRIYELYVQNGMQEDAKELEQEMRDAGLASVDEMHPFTMTLEIDPGDIERAAADIGSGDLAETVARYFSAFLPDKGQVEESIRRQAQEAPLQFLMTQTIVDELGNPLAQVGSWENDSSGRLAVELSTHISMQIPYMRRITERLREQGALAADSLRGYFTESPAFPSSSVPILEAGLAAYFERDHIAAISILVPIVELGVREVSMRLGASVYKPAPTPGGRIYRPLGDLLRDKRIVKLFGEDVSLYLQVLLTDQRGWNIRNAVCHGLRSSIGFDAATADRVLHVLCLLGQLRVKPE